MEIEWGETSRGFTIGEFKDAYDQPCSIQASSSVDPKIWFGVDDALWSEIYDRQKPYEKDGSTYRHVSARMHLTPDMAAELWPLLKAFAKSGTLPAPAKAAI